MTTMPPAAPETGSTFTFCSSPLPEPTPTPENALAALKTLRAEAEALIEKLIAITDAISGDADLEPLLAAPEQSLHYVPLDQRFWAIGTADAREDEHDGAEPDEDSEPEETDEEHDGREASLCGVEFGASMMTEVDLEEDAGSERELDCDSNEGDKLDEDGELDSSDAEPDLGWSGFCNRNGEIFRSAGAFGDYAEACGDVPGGDVVDADSPGNHSVANYATTKKDAVLHRKLRSRKPGRLSNITLQESLVGQHRVRLPSGRLVG